MASHKGPANVISIEGYNGATGAQEVTVSFIDRVRKGRDRRTRERQ